MSHRIVKIDETRCIGCTKCIDVCPVDAIIGASKQLHVVLEEDCIGCELCLPPCPVDCFEIIEKAPLVPEQRLVRAQRVKQRVQAKKARLSQQEAIKGEQDKSKTMLDIKAQIAASIARSQQKRKEMLYE